MESRNVKDEAEVCEHNFENIAMPHDLEDCLDENFDMCFNKVYEQLPVISYSKISDEVDRPENTTYIGKLQGHDENKGLVLSVTSNILENFILPKFSNTSFPKSGENYITWFESWISL